MINLFHIFILIIVLLLIKTLFLTNSNMKKRLLSSLMILTLASICIAIGLNVKQPISNLIDFKYDIEESRTTLLSFDYGQYSELNSSKDKTDLLKTILNDFEVKYTLRLPESHLSTSEDIVTVVIGSQFANRYFVVLSNNIIYFDDKYYKVENKDLYNYLIELITDYGDIVDKTP